MFKYLLEMLKASELNITISSEGVIFSPTIKTPGMKDPDEEKTIIVMPQGSQGDLQQLVMESGGFSAPVSEVAQEAEANTEQGKITEPDLMTLLKEFEQARSRLIRYLYVDDEMMAARAIKEAQC